MHFVTQVFELSAKKSCEDAERLRLATSMIFGALGLPTYSRFLL